MTSNETLLRSVLFFLLALLLLPVLMMVVMMPLMGGTGWSHMSGHGMWNGTGGWVAMLFMMLVPLMILIGIGYSITRVIAQSETNTDDAIDELRMAYARGDLSDEEFEHRRDRLQREEHSE